MHGVGDFARGGGVDGRAVDEEALLCGGGVGVRGEGGLEDGVEDGFDVRGFGEDGDDCFLCLCVSLSGGVRWAVAGSVTASLGGGSEDWL